MQNAQSNIPYRPIPTSPNIQSAGYGTDQEVSDSENESFSYGVPGSSEWDLFRPYSTTGRGEATLACCCGGSLLGLGIHLSNALLGLGGGMCLAAGCCVVGFQLDSWCKLDE